MRRSGFIVLMVLLVLGLSAAASVAENTDYLLGSGDVLKISVYDHPDLTTIARVDNDGFVIFPLTGRLQLGGLTTAAASDLIAEKLDNVYIINPQVSIFVEEFRSKKVVIIGEVMRPGLYELSGPISLLELISTAGGVTGGAGQTVTIRRPPTLADNVEKIMVVQLDDLAAPGQPGTSIRLSDGDSVTVEKAGVVYVTGQVNRPAAYALDQDTTVIKAIVMAGGFTPLASQRRVKVIRKIAGEKKILEKVSMDQALEPEDILIVPESYF